MAALASDLLVVLRINVDLAIFQPYLDLEAGDNQSLKIQVARPGIEPRSSCSASQELNHSANAAPIWLVETISTSLQLLSRIQRNLTGSKLSTSSTDRKTKIAYQFSWLTETFSTSSLQPLNLDRKKVLNVLYQVCVFQDDRKHQDGRSGLWLTEIFSTSYLQLLNRIQQEAWSQRFQPRC